MVEQYVEPHHADIERLVARQLHQLLGLGPRRVAHGGEDGCSGAGEMFGGEASETGGTSSDQDRLARQVGRGDQLVVLRPDGSGGKRPGGGGPGKQGAASQIRHGSLPLPAA